MVLEDLRRYTYYLYVQLHHNLVTRSYIVHSSTGVVARTLTQLNSTNKCPRCCHSPYPNACLSFNHDRLEQTRQLLAIREWDYVPILLTMKFSIPLLSSSGRYWRMRRCPSCEKSEFELRYPCSGTRKLTLRKCGNFARAASHPDQSTEHKLYDSSAVRIVTALRFGAIRWARMPKACLKMPVANRGTSRVSTLRALQGKRFSSARSSSGSRTEGG